MSVSVLSVSHSGPLFRSTEVPRNRSAATTMSGPPNLKRPWEQEQSPPRSSHASFHHQRHPLPQQQQPPQYQPGPPAPSVPGPPPPGHMQTLSRQSSQAGYVYPEASTGPTPPNELQPKRSRIESGRSSAAHSPTTGYLAGRISPGRQAQIPARLPGTGPPPGLGLSTERMSVSPHMSASQDRIYQSHGQAPMNAPVFPSPSSATSSAGGNVPPQPQPPLPPIGSSLLSPVSPSSTHLQNLQHEISTKSLAYNNLVSEHERLLGAYSRLQARLAAFDRKSKTADGEMAMLQEERISLQERVDALEQEVDEVRAAKEAEAEQRNRDSEQWRRIIDLSGSIQRRHTEENETWKTEKNSLLRRVEGLENELQRVRLSTGSVASDVLEGVDVAGPSTSGTSQLSASPDPALYDMLRAEVASLRQQSEQARQQLDAYRERMGELKELLTRADRIVGAGQAELRR